MPEETQQAVNWSLQQIIKDEFGKEIHVTKENHQAIVDKVREYFNKNNIEYPTFSYEDLKQYLPQ